MDTQHILDYLDQPATGVAWLKSLRLTDPERGQANLVRIATQGVPLDLLTVICGQLEATLPRLSDPDMALNNLERFIQATRNPLAMSALFERDPETLPTLLEIFSTSQYLSDLLIRDPESYDILRMTDGAPVAREAVVAELINEVDTSPDEPAVMAALRRFKHRETLRIAYGDIVHDHSLETVTRQISYLADAIVEAAVQAAGRKAGSTRGTPLTASGQPARFTVLALGKLGGAELNYSSDIDLVLLYDEDGRTDGQRSVTNAEFYDQLARQMIRLLTESTELGSPYRVDMRLRPMGSQGPLVQNLQSMLHYYDVSGRTWERQAFIKARPIAGNQELGQEFLQALQPWIYRRYLSLADITGIKALKRRIEKQALREDADQRNVKTGHGGIRDIEFVIQFLQLVNGGTLPEVRTGNTLEAIKRLEQNQCLTFQERQLLEENYCFLRKVEHRLQLMSDLQTHLLPDDPEALDKLAIRMGFSSETDDPPRVAFLAELTGKGEVNHKILDHLLHDAFDDGTQTEAEIDLVNDPDPPRERIHEVLSAYPFQDIDAAYDNLMALATEKIRFLSTRRCRHFLAAIAPRLLEAIATTPNPDSTLVNLSQVSDSLGGKGVLWELFSFNPPSLNLYVRLCAACPYLSSTLTSNPGMIDELMDSLVLEHLPSLAMLERTLADLCRGAEDLDPILHSFKDAQHLRVGVRDILGKDAIEATHATLSDIAETCLKQITLYEFDRLTKKLGHPTIGHGPRTGQVCEMIILALGKLGGREPNYHSDLDVIFLYEADGSTVHARRNGQKSSTTNQHFFSELGQRIIKWANRMGPYGRLYEVDPRLRPTGRSGSLAVPIDEFRRYFAEGDAQHWERQALCKARVIFGSPEATTQAMSAVAEAAFGLSWRSEDARTIRDMRARLEETAGPRNLKRGRGGTVDVEFLTQMLQLQHGTADPQVRKPGTLEALAALHQRGYLSQEDFVTASAGYRHLRAVEARIRLMNAAGRHEMPEDSVELAKLAYLLDYDDPQALVIETSEVRCANRDLFERLVRRATR